MVVCRVCRLQSRLILAALHGFVQQRILCFRMKMKNMRDASRFVTPPEMGLAQNG